MPVLENAKHELFAQGLAKGLTADEAYEKAGYKPDRGNAVRLTANDSVTARVRELQDETSKAIAFTKQDLLKFLVDVIQTPIGEVDEASPLCQEYSIDEINTGQGRGKLRRGNADEGNETAGENIIRSKYKMPGKLDAGKLMAQLCGWNAPEKHDVTLTGPRGVLGGILKRKKS